MFNLLFKHAFWDSLLLVVGMAIGSALTILIISKPIPQKRSAGYVSPENNFDSSPWKKEILIAATAEGLDPNILYAIVEIESGNDPAAVSVAGAQGLAQLMPAIQSAFGVSDPFDPAQNLAGAAKFLAHLVGKYDQLELAVAGYHAGEPLVDQCNCVPRPIDVEYVTRFFTIYKPVQLPYRVKSTLTNGLHGQGDWAGNDYATNCGTPIYAPITGEISAKGVDNYVGPHGRNNTFLQVTGTEQHSGLKVVLLHGEYSVNIGDNVIQGITRLGSEASIGNSTGCHTHLIVKYQGRVLDPAKFIQ